MAEKELYCLQCGQKIDITNFGKGRHMFCCRRCRDKYTNQHSSHYQLNDSADLEETSTVQYMEQ